MASLYKIKYLINDKNKKTLYYAWVESIFRYGIQLYGWAKKTYIDKIQKIQNKVVKILFKKKNTNVTNKDLYTKHNILNIRQLRDCVLVCDNYYSNEFKKVSVKKAALLRSSTYRFEVPFVMNDHGKKIGSIMHLVYSINYPMNC